MKPDSANDRAYGLVAAGAAPEIGIAKLASHVPVGYREYSRNWGACSTDRLARHTLFAEVKGESVNIHTIYGLILPRFRRRRFEMFVDELEPTDADHILDIGGYPDNWIQQPPVGFVDVLNLVRTEHDPASCPQHRISTLAGDGTALSFDDDAYDIVFSNSVVEHVGDFDAQRAFAREALRVGRRLWVQTPAKEFFFEPHFLAPFIHWFPVPLRYRAARFTPWALLGKHDQSDAKAMVDEIRLLSHSEMKLLFPDCEIRREKVFGLLTKSYIAIRT